MSFWDMIFGAGAPPKGRLEPLFRVPGAALSLELATAWRFDGRCGLAVKKVEGSRFEEALEEAHHLLQLLGDEFGVRGETSDDGYGYRWFLLMAPRLDDAVPALHGLGEVWREKGYERQLLASVFSFSQKAASGLGYLIYNYRRARFYSFVPGAGEERNATEEFRWRSLLSSDLPWEEDVQRWYPLWDVPLAK
ncbi:MAG: hypothetical protein QJR00_07980, partial [Bacillota bacterium]|nr:hypothetical protein [Bacillota bacterium]